MDKLILTIAKNLVGVAVGLAIGKLVNVASDAYSEHSARKAKKQAERLLETEKV